MIFFLAFKKKKKSKCFQWLPFGPEFPLLSVSMSSAMWLHGIFQQEQESIHSPLKPRLSLWLGTDQWNAVKLMCEFQSLGLKKPGLLLCSLLPFCLFHGSMPRLACSKVKCGEQSRSSLVVPAKIPDIQEPKTNKTTNCECISEPSLNQQNHPNDL